MSSLPTTTVGGTAVVKPPYRIPLMSEIAARPANGYSFVSTFSGCGGSCLGFEMDGWTPLLASEFVPAAQEVYALNHPGVPIAVGDVRDLEAELIMARLGLRQGELHCFEGSPPCASFSTAGKRNAGWGQVRKYSDTEQRTDDLFFEYVRLLRGLMPMTFVAENVTGLTKGVAKGYFKEIHAALVESGYRVRAMTLDAQWLGVPQARQRVIFCGVREDLGLDPPTVQPLPYRYTVRDAIPLAVRIGTAPPHKDWQAAGKSVEATMVDAGSNAAPTMVASGENKGAGWVEIRVPVGVIHDRGKTWKAKGDVTDEPCPTITIGVDSLNSYHYQVEEEVVRIPARTPAGDVSDYLVPLEAVEAAILSGEPLALDVSWIHYGNDKGSVADRPSPAITAHGVSGGNDDTLALDEIPAEAFLGRAVGAEWDKLRPGEQSERYLNLTRPHPDAPCPTVTAVGGTGAASVTHPIERRKFTIPELKRICGFPDDFQLTGNYRQQWERLGRAVPPPMMRAVAEAVREQVLERVA